jgi:hypothetical protein
MILSSRDEELCIQYENNYSYFCPITVNDHQFLAD